MHKLDPTEPANMIRLRELSAQWNASQNEQEALWQREGRPRGKAWGKVVQPLWDEQERIEDELEPLLFVLVKDEGLGGLDIFGNLRTEYAKVRQATGLKMHGHRMRVLIGNGYARWQKAEWHAKLHAMTDEEFAAYMDGFCTTTDEGKALKQEAARVRAELVHGITQAGAGR